MVEALQDYLENELWHADTLGSVIPTVSGDPSHLLQIDIQSPSIEIGARQGRVHSHFIVKVRHMDKVLIGGIQSRMQAHVRANSPFRAAFVSVTLMDTHAENYALKEAYVEG